MAIDDNASYELTEAQVKDLANKIKAKAADNIFVGATSAAPGSKGLVPAPQAGDDTKFLKGDVTWAVAGGNGVSMFYTDSDHIYDTDNPSDNHFTLYKDVSLTTAATCEEVVAAVSTGPVFIMATYYPEVFAVASAYDDSSSYWSPYDTVYLRLVHYDGIIEIGRSFGQWRVERKIAIPTIIQTTGQSTTSVMSQKAVTDIIGNVETILQTLNSGNGAQ